MKLYRDVPSGHSKMNNNHPIPATPPPPYSSQASRQVCLLSTTRDTQITIHYSLDFRPPTMLVRFRDHVYKDNKLFQYWKGSLF